MSVVAVAQLSSDVFSQSEDLKLTKSYLEVNSKGLVSSRETLELDEKALREIQQKEEIEALDQVIIERDKIHGYIIQFKEEPIAVKKSKLKKTKKGYPSVQKELNKHIVRIEETHNRAKEDIVNILKGSSTLDSAATQVLSKIKEYKTVFNGIALNISRKTAMQIQNLPYVKEVYEDREVHITLNESIPLINADDVWALTDSYGRNITGKNITIAIIDTGIDYTHEDLGNCTEVEFLNGSCDKIIDGYDFINNDNNPMDDHGHGTHCAATAAGSGVLEGVAPNAKLHAYKVLNSGGSGAWSQVIAGIERAVDPNDDGNFSDHVDVISMSLGGTGDPEDPVSTAVDNAVKAGVVAVVAAGNSGPSEQTIDSPGTARKAITVGASYKSSFASVSYSGCTDTNTTVDDLACFSSRGPVVWEHGSILKPDIVAPGVGICAAQWDTAFGIDDDYNNPNRPDLHRCIDDKHVSISGTSMATPHIAGVVALLKQAHPDWSPIEIKLALRNTASDIGYNLIEQGYGRVDVLAAVQLTSSPPIAIINTSGKIVSGILDVIGTATADVFLNYNLSFGVGINPISWTEICTSTSPVSDGVLCSWDNQWLADGDYTLRLEVRSSDQTSIDMTFIKIKNTEITSPINLLGLSWSDTKEILGGWRHIHINGTAAGTYFSNYSIDYKLEGGAYGTDGITPINNGQIPVVNGLLADWNLSVLTQTGFYYLRLRNYNTIGLWQTDEIKIYIDVELHPGWPRPLNEGQGGIAASFMDQPTLVDIDNDGKKDLVFAYGRDIKVLRHDGSNIPGWPKTINTSCSWDATMQRGPAVGDLDNDNYNEIVIGDTCGYLHAFNHDGTYLNGWPIYFSSYFNTPSFADIDNDGNLDIIISDRSVLRVMHKNGSSLPGWPQYVGTTYRGYMASIADLDDDGYNELAFCGDSRTAIFNHDGSAVAGWPKLGSCRVALALADLDKDYEIEIITTNASGNVFAWNLDGSNVPGWPVASGAGYPDNPIVGDIDNDNSLEVVFTGGGCLWAYENNGALVVGFPVCYNPPTVAIQPSGQPMLGDLDGDNYQEFTVVESGGTVYASLIRFYAFNHDGSIAPGFPKFLDDISLANGATLGDLDGDGDNEVMVHTWSGNFYVWDMPGDASNSDWPVFYHDERHTGANLDSIIGVQAECEQNGTEWVNCSELSYWDNLTRVRANCTSMNQIINATYKLENLPDSAIYFDVNNATSVEEGWWIYDNNDFTILDSGNWRLIVSCIDNTTAETIKTIEWLVPWGVLEPYLISPLNNISVTRHEFFNFSSGVSCVGGECGDVNVTLDPYGPDGFNYTALNSTEPEGDPFVWEEIITNGEGTALWNTGQIADDSYLTAPINFAFQFYGQSYTIVYVSSNGRIHFTSHNADTTSIGLPSDNYKVIAPINRDMYVKSQTQVFYKTYNNHPKRFIVEYKELDHYSPSGNYLTYEVILYEDGRIKIQYKATSDPYSQSNAIGINYGSTNNYNLLIENDAPDLHKGEAVTFYPTYYQAGKGTIPMNNGTPFYTIDENPTLCENMTGGGSCEKLWEVNATGEYLSSYNFFVIYYSIYPLVGENITDEVNIKIIGNYAPVMTSVECEENNSIWEDCSGILYNDYLTKVRVNCTDEDGNVANVNVKLENIYDNNIFFDDWAVQNGDYWIYDNNDLNILDSGDFRLSVNCTDNGGSDGVKYDNETVEWFIPWGNLQSYLIEPLNNISVTRHEFFNFSSGVSCVGGECGNVSASLDPEIIFFFDNMESGTNGWNYTGFWHLVNETSPYPNNHSPTHSWWYGRDETGDYHNGTTNSGELISPVVDLTNAVSANLSFWYWYETETTGTSYDQRWIYIKVGDSWQSLEQLSGDAMNVWNFKTINITPYINDTIQIRFYFDTIDPVSNIHRGWYIDDVSIVGESTGKGIIPMNNGTPFYTIDENPTICQNMKGKDTCETIWQVNANGDVNSTYEFFTIYEPLQHQLNSSETDRVNITIVQGLGEIFNINLSMGWNLISIPLKPADNTLKNILSSIEGNYGNVFTYNNNWQQLNNNSIINNTIGLWIKMLSDDNLTINGTLPILPTSFNLKQGLNLIGYPSLNESDVSFVFEDINDSLINVLSYENNSWKSYNPLKIDELNSLKEMKPGYGYWVDVDENVSLEIS